MAFRIRHYPHNDLLNLASYHRQVILQKVDAQSQEGLALDCTSCLIALAFAVEALINFVGARAVTDWNERDHSPAKVRKLSKKLRIRIAEDVEPYRAIWTLRQIRNGLAHGKPVRKTADCGNEAGLKQALRAPWDPYLNPADVEALYIQVKALRTELFKAAEIDLADSLTSAVGAF